MKICSVVFQYPGYRDYEKLMAVLEYSVYKNCPKADFELVRITAPKTFRDKRCFASNNVKLAEWLRVMKGTNDDVVFMDADMMVLRDLRPAFEEKFDVGYTVHARTTDRLPFNCGVVFVRNTTAAREFVQRWMDVDNRMYRDPKLHGPYRAKYAGMNQASFGYMLEKDRGDARLKQFRCREWNACKEDWGAIDETTRAVHVKSDLRRMILAGTRIESCGKNARAVTIWRALASEAANRRARAVRQVSYEKPADEAEISKVREASLDATEIVKKGTIAYLSKILRRIMRPSFGICHGSGMGKEQRWFAEYLGCEVIGTEVARGTEKIPATVVWDFNKFNKDWAGSADFIYSNSLHQAMDRDATLRAWAATLKPRGVMLLEMADTTSPELIEWVGWWGAGEWRVAATFELGTPGTVFALIERAKAVVEEPEAMYGDVR